MFAARHVRNLPIYLCISKAVFRINTQGTDVDVAQSTSPFTSNDEASYSLDQVSGLRSIAATNRQYLPPFSTFKSFHNGLPIHYLGFSCRNFRGCSL